MFMITPMQVQATLSQMPLEQLVKQIFSSHKITRDDQRLLMSMFSKPSLSHDDLSLVKQVHEALSKGLVRVVD